MTPSLDLNQTSETTTSGSDIVALFSEREPARYTLHTRHMNEMMVRVLQTIGFDVGFRRGTGQYLFDNAGQRYLDLLSGWGAFGIGRNHPRLREALTAVLAADLPNLVQMDVPPLAGILAERLLRYTPFLEKVFFTNSGAEAVESSIKFARRATGRPGLVYCTNAFHGLSYGALSLNGDHNFRDGFGPLLPHRSEVPFNDLEGTRERTCDSSVAFIVEPIQGKGVNIPDDSYLPCALELCRQYGSLLIADEIQTGLGRTGRFLAIEHWGIEPDMVLLSKTLSGGHVPVAAVLARKWILGRVFDRMDRAVVHHLTFANNDLAMAAGLATLDVLESDGLVENTARMGARLLAAFQVMAKDYEMVREVRGKGLMIGIEFGRPHSLKLQAAWGLLEAVSTGLFCQLITIPLCTRHRILAQVAGHSHRVPGAIWSFGRTLVAQARKARAVSVGEPSK
jgi:ornithine--oxo-acid transaminase